MRQDAALDTGLSWRFYFTIALKEGKGHPNKSTASDADLKTMVQYVLSVQ